MHIGRTQELPVWMVGDAGVLLGDRKDHVILPAHEDPGGLSKGDRLRVFVTTDTHDRVTATLLRPRAEVGQLALMTAVGTTAHGAFMDWGLPKDLFVPWKHQHVRLEVGDRAVVYVTLDETQRPVGYTKLVDILVAPTDRLHVNQKVRALVYGSNELGLLCAVNGTWSGLIYEPPGGELPFRLGDEVEAWIERVRPEGKLDLSLRPVGREGTLEGADEVLRALEEEGGFLRLTDDSSPDAIRRRLGLSKKVFKKAVGALYRQRKVLIEADGIRRR